MSTLLFILLGIRDYVCTLERLPPSSCTNDLHLGLEPTNTFKKIILVPHHLNNYFIKGRYIWLFVHFSDIGKIAEEFWQEKGPYTPESRRETYEFLRLQKEQESKKSASFECAKCALFTGIK